MKKTNLTILLAAMTMFIVLFSACDIIERPYIEETGNAIGADSLFVKTTLETDPFAGVTIERTVLLEEFTGHKCGNCPESSELAVELRDNVHKDRMYLLSVHAGSLAKYTPGAAKYSTKHTTVDGDDYFAEFFPVDAVPFALINRTLNSGGIYLYGEGDWRTVVGEQLNRPAEAGVHVSTLLDSDTRKLTIVVQATYLADATDKEFLSVYLAEDEVIDWQKDYRLSASDEDVQDYHHHEMFRGAINGTWGEALSAEAVKNGDSFSKVYSFDLDPGFDENHCKVIAFVQNFDTKEIRQVAVAKVTE